MDLMSILRQAGFSGQGLQIAYAVAMAESGGRAKAHNGNASTGDNSYGLFQINMLGSMGPDRRRRYGLSSNEDLYDPLTNARIAYQMSKGGTSWGPWTTYTSGKYRKYLGQSGAVVDTAGGGGGGSYDLTPVTAKMDDKTLATYYGLSKKLIDSDKSLKKIFNQAVKENWTPEVFTAHLKNTTWWTKNSDSMRKYLTSRWTDPATWKNKWQQTAYAVNALAVQVGLGNLLGKGTDLGKMDDLLEKATYNMYALGWSDARVKDWLGSQVTTHGGVMWGEAGENFDKLHSVAYANGMTYSNSWYRDQAKAIAGGKKTYEQLDAEIRKSAAARWKPFATQIKAGMNALDLAAGYISSVSGLLELPSTSVDLGNKYVAKAMSSTNKDGSAYSLWQLENDVRADPLWRKTKNAQDSMSTIAHQVLTDFGLMGN